MCSATIFTQVPAARAHSGLRRLATTKAAGARPIATVNASRSTVRIIDTPLASIKPRPRGTNAALRTATASLSDQRARTRAVRRAQDGIMIASVATRRPAQPATCQPIRLTTMTLGPGAALAMAKVWAKAASVIQPWTSTTCRRISGRSTLMPPIDTRESIAKVRASSANTLVMSDAPAPSRRWPPAPERSRSAPAASRTRRSKRTPGDDNEGHGRQLDVADHLHRRAQDEAGGRGADQADAHLGDGCEAVIDRGERRHDHQRHRHHAKQAERHARRALEALADDDGGVHRVRAWQHLTHAQDFGELLVGEPAALLDDVVTGPRPDTPEA